jgi:DNA-binding transcriptional MerR regulator
MDTKQYSLSEVTQMTGAKRRSVQLWADGGVIQSTAVTDRAGTGNHRQFQADEVRIVALLVPLAEMGTPIGVLRTFSNVLRWAAFHRVAGHLSGLPTGLAAPVEQVADISKAMSRAEKGEGQNYLLIAHEPDGLWIDAVTDEVGAVAIDPARNFRELHGRRRTAIIILDLTSQLSGLLA